MLFNKILDDIDFNKLKLPIEPQNLIYMYLAYKLINNLDKIQIGTPIPRHIPIPKPINVNSLNSLFIFVMFLVGSLIIMNTILNKISFTEIKEPRLLDNTRYVKTNSPKNCNLNKCPLFNTETLLNIIETENIDKCPEFKKCPVFNSCNKNNVDNIECNSNTNNIDIKKENDEPKDKKKK